MREALRRKRPLPTSEQLNLWRLPLLNPRQDKYSQNFRCDFLGLRTEVKEKRKEDLFCKFIIWSDVVSMGFR